VGDEVIERETERLADARRFIEAWNDDGERRKHYFVIPSEVEESLILAVRDVSTPLDMTILFINLHHNFAVRIDVTAIHSRRVKWQRDVALAVDRDQPAGAAELCDFF
jgi:hypothetical protein